jgi:hypothetical protein
MYFLRVDLIAQSSTPLPVVGNHGFEADSPANLGGGFPVPYLTLLRVVVGHRLSQ